MWRSIFAVSCMALILLCIVGWGWLYITDLERRKQKLENNSDNYEI